MLSVTLAGDNPKSSMPTPEVQGSIGGLERGPEGEQRRSKSDIVEATKGK